MAELDISDLKSLSYEEDLLRNPYSFKGWWYYLDFSESSLRPLNRLCARLCRQFHTQINVHAAGGLHRVV
jgi:hypothetical protein